MSSRAKAFRGFTGRDAKTYVAAGAISMSVDSVLLDSTAGAMAMSLANGENGQRIAIVLATAADVTLTLNLLGADNTLIFSEISDAVELVYLGSAWQIVSAVGAVSVSTV